MTTLSCTGTDTGTHTARPAPAARPHRPTAHRPTGAPALLVLSTRTAGPGEQVVVASGEIDLGTAPELRSWLSRALEHPSCASLVVDLRGVRFLGACGIGVLATLRATALAHDVRFAVVADRRAVLRPLRLVASEIPVHATPAAARAAGHRITPPAA